MDIYEAMVEPSRKPDAILGCPLEICEVDLYETVLSEYTTEESDCQPQACQVFSSSPHAHPQVDNKSISRENMVRDKFVPSPTDIDGYDVFTRLPSDYARSLCKD